MKCSGKAICLMISHEIWQISIRNERPIARNGKAYIFNSSHCMQYIKLMNVSFPTKHQLQSQRRCCNCEYTNNSLDHFDISYFHNCIIGCILGRICQKIRKTHIHVELYLRRTRRPHQILSKSGNLYITPSP